MAEGLRSETSKRENFMAAMEEGEFKSQWEDINYAEGKNWYSQSLLRFPMMEPCGRPLTSKINDIIERVK